MSRFPTLVKPPVRLMLATLLVAGAGALATTAHAMPAGGMGPGMAHGHGMMMHGGPGQPGRGPGAGPVQRMLDQVQATPEQRTRIREILDAARADVRKLHEAAAPLREQARQLWSQPTIDAAAAEALRKQQFALRDQVGQRMLQARLDAAAVLSPEQRKALADHRARRHEMMQRHRAERQSLDGMPPGRRW